MFDFVFRIMLLEPDVENSSRLTYVKLWAITAFDFIHTTRVVF